MPHRKSMVGTVATGVHVGTAVAVGRIDVAAILTFAPMVAVARTRKLRNPAP